MTTIRKINVSEVDGGSLDNINKSQHPQGQMALYEEYDNNLDRDVWKLRLPEGGVISESLVTENPTIELKPADSDVESQKLVIKGGAADDYHLHLTNGDLTVTSLILGTDEHNVRTTTDGGIQITAYNYGVQEQKYWYFDPQGSLTFPDGDVQTTAYAGTNGRLMFIDTNRTGDYTANGSADKPFKTFTAAIETVAELNPDGTVPYTFVLMGCGINETVDFSSRNFNFITISTTCRSVFNQPVIFGNSALKQLVIRNVEFANTFTITGDGTEDQLNNVSIYNTSFTGAVNITATNATAFYEAAFFGAVNFTNLSYLYINGAQFNTNWTITADSDGVIPSKGINPGTGGSIAIVFSTIANNVIFVKGGTAAYVFQPHMTRMGLGAGTYTIPAGWTFTPHSSVLRGTWVNNGSASFRNTSHDNAIGGTAPTYVGTIGAANVKFQDGTTQTTAWTGTYAPTTAGDWAEPAPTTIQAALDRLAIVVKALNSGTGA